MNSERMMWKMKRREHMAMRTLAAVIVTVFVFWCGFEFGEIRASVGMHGYGGQYMMYSGRSITPVYNTMPSTNVPAQTSASAK